jgi:hypothetical protein
MGADREYFRKRLLGVLCATWTAQACSVFAVLGLADRMAAGARSAARLAEAADLDPLALKRLLAANFSAAMSVAPEPSPPAAWLFEGAHTMVDVGGGDGGLLAEVLSQHPELHGVLVELPEAVARARGRLAEAGLLDRVRIVAGSFFDDVPADGDLCVLRRVLHNWTDANACRVLARVREAMHAGGRLLVLEELLPTAPEASSASASPWAAPRNRIVDLLMLVLMEGRDRTAEEYTTLLLDSGFAVKNITPGAIEAVPV